MEISSIRSPPAFPAAAGRSNGPTVCDDWEGLCEVVQAALARIANWEQAMDEAAALNAA